MSVEFGGPVPSVAAQNSDIARTAPEPRERQARPVAEREDEAAPREEREERVRALLERLADAGPNVHARLSIDLDKEADAFVYRILDSRSGEVMRQFPAEEALELMKFLGEQRGLVVDRKV